jgi:large subunit ribosomal protein L29
MENSVIKELSSEELNSRIIEEKHNLAKMRMAHAVSPIENPLSLRTTKRLIARLLTEQTKRANQ